MCAVHLGAAHWSFEPVTAPAPPAVKDNGWAQSAVDRFILARLEREGLKPSPEAPKAALLRRLCLDLTGLPPTLEQQQEFLSDNRPDAYERMVESLLKSPHYGEKWGRYWLDLARYADSDGFRSDRFRPNAWRYRDWIIAALNRDMPFDRFTIEQLAGDLLPGASLEQRVATGFHRNTLTNREGGIDPEQFRVEQVIDRVNTTATVWLGLTIGCAQCHDHKYDPITQREYYRLFAFFNTAEELDIDAPVPGEAGPRMAARPSYDRERAKVLEKYGVPGLMPEWERRMIEAAANPGKWLDWDHAFDDLRTDLDQGEKILRTVPEKRTRRQTKLLTDYFVSNYHRVITKERRKELAFDDLRKALRALDESLPRMAEAPVFAHERPDRTTHIFDRGDYKNPRERVEPGVPAILPALDSPAGGPPTRLDLARWLVSPEHPLTARVFVNRVWQEYFGVGLVKTADNFGSQGERPSHPELLDWLAADFAKNRWSMKALHRTIVSSAAYRQSSVITPELAKRDPANRLIARQGRFRLPAESIRDSALQASGLLSPETGGPSVRVHEANGRDRYRRGLYIDLRRTAPYALLSNFDAPNGYRPVCSRGRSNTPLQALQLLNDPLFVEAARALAVRADGDLDRMFRMTLARTPAADERAWLSEKIDRVSAASVLLNLDEFLTRE